jgi:hypothetical protein
MSGSGNSGDVSNHLGNKIINAAVQSIRNLTANISHSSARYQQAQRRASSNPITHSDTETTVHSNQLPGSWQPAQPSTPQEYIRSSTLDTPRHPTVIDVLSLPPPIPFHAIQQILLSTLLSPTPSLTPILFHSLYLHPPILLVRLPPLIQPPPPHHKPPALRWPINAVKT